MELVEVERVLGDYIVGRRFESLAAAMRGVDALLSVHEDAFRTGLVEDAPPEPEAGPELSPLAAVMMEMQDEEAATAHLKAGEALNPVNQSTGD